MTSGFTCFEHKIVDGIMHKCVLEFHHDGEHRFSEITPITLTIDKAITDDEVSNVTDELNDQIDDGPNRYSTDQVKRALWKFIVREIDELQENLEERFIKYADSLGIGQFDRLLGFPELDLKEEAQLERADYLYDVARGN